VKIPLRLPSISAEGYDIQRSGFRWLCPNGHRCRAGEVIAWCHIGLASRPGFPGRARPFREEHRDFQAALAPRQSGRLFKAPGLSRGGWLDIQDWHHFWSGETVLGHLDCAAEAEGLPPEAEPLRLLFLAGRRVTECAEVRGAPLTGWHDRSRAWWTDGDDAFRTVLSLGSCEQLGIMRGERAFFELFGQCPGPAHVVLIPDNLLVPSAPVISGGLARSPAESEKIADDMARALAGTLAPWSKSGAAPAQDWLFAGCLLKALTHSPLGESYPVLSPGGVKQLDPADVVMLSLLAESSTCLRHKRLGYMISFHPYRMSEFGPALSGWLRTDFELVSRTVEDFRRDLLTLIDALQARAKTHVLVLNVISSTSLDDVYCYAPFTRPLGNALASIHAKEMNLMLYELARARDISVVDVDAIAAALGIGKHVPDGAHQSGRLQKAVRAEIMGILRDRGLAGFGSIK
jgi:hypothetical protein